MCRKHFAMCINVYASTSCLSKKLFHIFKVMTADEDCWIVSYADVDFCDFWIAVSACMCAV